MGETSIPEAAARELARGSKIGAIKLVREANNLGLKEAKELVELYIDENPALQKKMSEANSASGKSFLMTIVVLGLIAALIYFGLQEIS